MKKLILISTILLSITYAQCQTCEPCEEGLGYSKSGRPLYNDFLSDSVNIDDYEHYYYCEEYDEYLVYDTTDMTKIGQIVHDELTSMLGTAVMGRKKDGKAVCGAITHYFTNYGGANWGEDLYDPEKSYGAKNGYSEVFVQSPMYLLDEEGVKDVKRLKKGLFIYRERSATNFFKNHVYYIADIKGDTLYIADQGVVTKSGATSIMDGKMINFQVRRKVHVDKIHTFAGRDKLYYFWMMKKEYTISNRYAYTSNQE